MTRMMRRRISSRRASVGGFPKQPGQETLNPIYNRLLGCCSSPPTLSPESPSGRVNFHCLLPAIMIPHHRSCLSACYWSISRSYATWCLLLSPCRQTNRGMKAGDGGGRVLAEDREMAHQRLNFGFIKFTSRLRSTLNSNLISLRSSVG